MFIVNRQRAASRNQFRLFVNIGDVLPVFHDALHPMLFHPEFTDSEPPTAIQASATNSQDATTLKNSYKMFSPTSPSPTRSMIKEANDHLQLLHQRVGELERTVQEQAEALIKKDDAMQTKLRDLSDMKDAKIRELNRTIEIYEQRIKKLEHLCREKDSHLETLTQKCGFVEELAAYTPILDRLVVTLKKLPPPPLRHHHHLPSSSSSVVNANSHGTIVPTSSKVSGSKSRSGRLGGPRSSASKTSPAAAATSVSQGNSSAVAAVGGEGVDGHPPSQALADLRIGRSFSINQNFSMSEDEAEEYS